MDIKEVKKRRHCLERNKNTDKTEIQKQWRRHDLNVQSVIRITVFESSLQISLAVRRAFSKARRDSGSWTVSPPVSPLVAATVE
jgi:hypothetical protein